MASEGPNIEKELTRLEKEIALLKDDMQDLKETPRAPVYSSIALNGKEVEAWMKRNKVGWYKEKKFDYGDETP